MKKPTARKSLSLKTETVRSLRDAALRDVVGGAVVQGGGSTSVGHCPGVNECADVAMHIFFPAPMLP